MSEPFVGEIRIFAGNFAPRGWAFCNGQLLPVSQNTALFSILGKIYGGDGKTNFALPNLQGRAPMHQGIGPGLTPHSIGEADGSATVTLLQSQMPAHTHQPMASEIQGIAGQTPEGSVWGQAWVKSGPRSMPVNAYVASPENTQMGGQALTPTGASGLHNNMQPYLGLSFIIALQGVYPVRS